jgi:hypothetical protein
MTSAPPEVWSRLRATRSAPPGRATATPPRRRTYAAAMEQFEELMRAAEQVGPAARPLPLFYALSQAGRAVTAAQADEPWQLRGHGLQLKDEGRTLLDRRVSPEGGPGTSFRRVAEATGSAVLQQPVTVGALCASLPDLAVVTELCGAKPRALSVQPIAKSGGAVLVMSRDVEAYVVNLPAAIATAEDTASALRDHLLGYPTVAGWALPDPLRLFPPSDGWGAATVLRWRVSEDVQSPNEPDRQARMREVAPQYRHSDQQWCRPAVAPGTLLSPLMTWWGLLYALSMVARYEPAEWAGLLSIDHSELAVPLEGVLVDALEVVPHLVLDALQETPLLLRPIPRYGG